MSESTTVVAPESAPNPPDPIYQFFAFAHLPAHLQEVSRPFAELATFIVSLPRNAERTVALRKLLESKDAAVRARVAAIQPMPVLDAAVQAIVAHQSAEAAPKSIDLTSLL